MPAGRKRWPTRLDPESSIAVVIPLFNHERYVAAAIASVRQQTRAVENIVVVDDGSSDGSIDAVRGIDDARIALFMQTNAGAHAALNRAIHEARDSEFIAVLNSDDLYHPERIERCVAFLQATPQAEVVCTNLGLIDDAGRELDNAAPPARWARRVWAARRELPGWLGIANFARTSSNFVARSRWLHDHPFRAYRYVHDYFLALEAVFERKLAVLDERLLFYRIHGANTIRSEGPENVRREVLQMNLDLLRELAPKLKNSPEARSDYTQYFRSLAGNYVDFRAELFLFAISRLVEDTSPEIVLSLVRDLDAGAFPELTQPSSKVLKDANKLNKSTWVRIGRSVGFIRE